MEKLANTSMLIIMALNLGANPKMSSKIIEFWRKNSVFTDSFCDFMLNFMNSYKKDFDFQRTFALLDNSIQNLECGKEVRFFLRNLEPVLIQNGHTKIHEKIF